MQGQRPCPRSAERGTLLMLHKDQEGGLRGKPYQGVSPFFFTLVRVRRYVGRWSLDCPAVRPRFFAQEQRNGVERAVGATIHLPAYRRTRTNPQTSTSPLPQVGRGTSRPPTGSAHANGGAAEVKKALFFGGSTPFLWASTKEMGSNGRTGQRPPPNVTAHTHQAKNKRGNPRRGFPPWTPSCAFVSIKGDSALCGARPGTLSLDPAAFEKVDETFIRLGRRACRTWCGATGGGADSGRSGSGGGARSPAPGCRGGGWSARACL